MSRSHAAPLRADRSLAPFVLALLAGACGGRGEAPAPPADTPAVPGTSGDGAEGAAAPAGRTNAYGTPLQGYEVLERYPHDRTAYTQGLLVVDGELYESTGQRGRSSVRRIDLETGEPQRNRPLDGRLFGEGLAATGGLLVQLTWTSRVALVWDRASLRKLDYTYTYAGEGWGLTTRDDGLFVMSDGTPTLRIVDPKGFEVVDTVDVTDGGQPVEDLNELEWIEGEIWANVWKSDRIARIDPETGVVRAWIDLAGILAPERVPNPNEQVLNGIAYDADTKAIYVTGKEWPSLFRIRVVE